MKFRTGAGVVLSSLADAMRTSESNQATQLDDRIWTTSCSEHHEKHGDIDRWIVVTHKDEFGSLAEDNAGFSFRPFILRGRKDWLDKPVVKVISSLLPGSEQHEGPDECVDDWSATCKEEEEYPMGAMAFSSNSSCANSPELVLGGVSAGYMTVCSQNTSTGMVGYRKFWEQRASVYLPAPGGANESELLELPAGHCAILSPLSAASGIELEPLDSRIMGTAAGKFDHNRTQLQLVLDSFLRDAQYAQRSAEQSGGVVAEGIIDLAETAAVLSEDLESGSQEAYDRSLKWVGYALMASEVHGCLCCDMEEVPWTNSMADHCLVAYTLGGQNSSNPYSYYARVTAGTMYKLSAHVAGYFTDEPILNSRACQFACDSRMPDKYEEYAYQNVRMIPGAALRTWYMTAPVDGAVFGMKTVVR